MLAWWGLPVNPCWPFCHSWQVIQKKRGHHKSLKRKGNVWSQTKTTPQNSCMHTASPPRLPEKREGLSQKKARQPKSSYIRIRTYTYVYVFGKNLLIRSYTYLYVFILFKMNGKTCHYPAQSAEKLFVFFFKSGPKWLKMTGEVSRDP